MTSHHTLKGGVSFDMILEKHDLIFMEETRFSKLRQKFKQDGIRYFKNPFGRLHCYNLEENLILNPKTHQIIGRIVETKEISESSQKMLEYLNSEGKFFSFQP